MVGEEDPSDPRSFAGQAIWKRAIVLVSGSVMNLAFPIVVFATLFTLPHDTVIGTVTISGVSPDSPAQEAGLRPGDQVLEVEGKRVENHFDLIKTVTTRLGRPTEFTIRRGLIVTGLPFSPELAPVDKVTIVPRLRPPEHVVVEQVTDSKTEMSLREAQKRQSRRAGRRPNPAGSHRRTHRHCQPEGRQNAASPSGIPSRWQSVADGTSSRSPKPP